MEHVNIGKKCMEIRVRAVEPAAWQGDGLVLAVPAFEGELPADLARLDREVLGGALQEMASEGEFQGKADTQIGGRVGAGSIRKVAVLGLGPAEKITPDALRKAAAQALRWAERQKCQTLALAFPGEDPVPLVEGVALAAHRDRRFKTESPDKPSEKLTVTTVDLLGLPDTAQAAIAPTQALVDSVILARELVAAPANYVTPQTLADTATALAQAHPDLLSVEILEREQCQALGMGAFLGVAQASELPPKFIHLTYRHGEPKHKLAVVGKGLTFDSGGLNLKVGAGSSIELMKIDMAGAAATLATAKAIAHRRPANLEVHFIVAACENMISGRALHPGDILVASNGKHIEVDNTDAEGRLTLADALVFADRLGVEAIVDLATLTGACIVALGDSIAGLWATDDELAQRLQTASQYTGEKMWRMPLEEPYFQQMKSVVADFKNAGSRSGGSITAALFLKQFLDKTPAWAHIDLAGPVWTDKENGYHNAGATGYPVRTLTAWLESYATT